MLRFVFVDKENYVRYKRFLSCNEKFFNPMIRTPLVEYDKVVYDDSSLTLLLFNHNVFVGSIVGYGHRNKCFYVFSVIVLPKFRGRGFGKLLFNKFLKSINRERFKYLEGHFNDNSIRLLKGFMFLSKKNFRNWESTGKDFKYVKVRLI